MFKGTNEKNNEVIGPKMIIMIMINDYFVFPRLFIYFLQPLPNIPLYRIISHYPQKRLILSSLAKPS